MNILFGKMRNAFFLFFWKENMLTKCDCNFQSCVRVWFFLIVVLYMMTKWQRFQKTKHFQWFCVVNLVTRTFHREMYFSKWSTVSERLYISNIFSSSQNVEIIIVNKNSAMVKMEHMRKCDKLKMNAKLTTYNENRRKLLKRFWHHTTFLICWRKAASYGAFFKLFKMGFLVLSQILYFWADNEENRFNHSKCIIWCWVSFTTP